MLPFCSNVFNNSSIGNYYESLPFAHDQQPFSIPSPSCELASIVSSSSKQAQDLVGSTYHDHMHPPFSHLYFPSPLEDDDVILQQHLQQQQLLHHQQQQQQQKPVTMMKKSCKKDRHSKIRTARGLRDRRMRLSLDVAKKFFGLQDMLGFDKASKTVEWLLKQAGDNIRKLTREIHGHTDTQSSFSECEVVSGTEDAATEDVVDKLSREKQTSSSCAKNRIKKTNVRQSKNEMFNPLAKASRKKARERARERTKEKMERLQVKTCNDVDQEAKKMLISWSTVQSGGGTQSHNNFNSHQSSFEVVLGDEAGGSMCRFQAPHRDNLNEIDGQDADDAAHLVGKWSPCSSTILSYLQNTSASISQEFADSQLFGKPWELIYSSRPHYGLQHREDLSSIFQYVTTS